MTRQIKAGSTDVSVVIRIVDSTDGTPETGVVFNTSGLDLEYRREGAASVDITEATLAALTTAHADGGFLHIGNGYYRLDLPDAAVAAGATGVLIHGACTGMVVIGEYIELVAYDPYDAVRMGLTALPNAAAEAAGGLFTRGTGAGQINQPANGRIDANTITVSGTTQTARDLGASVLLSPGTGTGQVSLSSGAVTVGTNNDKTGYSLSAAGVQAIWDALTSALTTVGSIGKRIADYLDVAVSSRASQTSLDTMASDTATGILAIKNQTDQLTFTVTGQVDANSIAISGVDPTSLVDGVFAPYITLLARKDAEIATLYMETLATINVDAGGGPGTYDPTTDSQQAIRDRGDAAWTGGGGLSAQDVRDAMKLTPTPGGGASGSVDYLLVAIAGDTETILFNTNEALPAQIAALNDLSAQEVRDAMKLAPTAGAAAGGSIDDMVATVETNTQNIETDTQDIQTRLPAALVSGRMDASVGAMQNGVVTAAAVASGAIDADALAADAVDEILDEVIEGSLTLRQALRVLLAALANKASGGGTTTVTFRDLADSKARITATVDANGNRTAVTLDGS